MKHNYLKSNSRIITLLVLFIGLNGFSQNIEFTFANAENTNDGVDDFYEVDVMIQTNGGLADFKLGSGQIYINYNTSAFGINVDANSRFAVSANFAEGYFLGELAGFTSFYNINTINDHSDSRVSWAFSQGVSSGAMMTLMNTTARQLVHLKFKYVDVNQDPMVAFEDNETLVSGSRDQFFTACGPFDSASTTLDCTADVNPQNLNVQFVDAEFNSAGATLSNENFELLTGLSIYPNPAKHTLYIKGDVSKLTAVNVFNLTGQRIMTVKENFSKIDVSRLSSAMYIVKLATNDKVGIYKILVE